MKKFLKNILLRKKIHTDIKIDILRNEIIECMELCQSELENRKNGIEGEVTIEQLQEVIIVDLNEILLKLDSKNIPLKRLDRYSLAYGSALKMWNWNTEKSKELYIKLAKIHYDYQNLL